MKMCRWIEYLPPAPLPPSGAPLSTDRTGIVRDTGAGSVAKQPWRAALAAHDTLTLQLPYLESTCIFCSYWPH